MVKFYYVLSTFRVVGGMIKVFMELSSKNWAIHSPFVSDSDYWARPIWPYTEHELILENIPLYIRPLEQKQNTWSWCPWSSLPQFMILNSWFLGYEFRSLHRANMATVNYGLYIYRRGKKLKSLLSCLQLTLSQ